MNNIELERVLNTELNAHEFQDYSPNGLQVEGRSCVKRVVTGVTACQALLDEAVRLEADAVIVHHGYFWKGESPSIRGMKRRRLQTLLCNDINLYGYHLPLDAHPTLGNNVLLGHQMGVKIIGNIDTFLPHGVFDQPISPAELAECLEKSQGRQVLHCGDNGPEEIRTIAWCTGGGQSFIEQAAEFGVDAFVTGEVSEKTIHVARESGMHFYSAGHHATERWGIKMLGEWLADHHGLDVTFVDIPNPA
ncbi:MAG: type 2 GTP cyclohydrolase I [Enterobacteriaceae bacterium]|jgi:dinuclear metal center YbgI/SA1388 family protein|nr:type 2 GTP cyclohydrolase I [Enterobacteriaceae bacterium]